MASSTGETTDVRYLGSLVKEAALLIDDLAKMDKKIEKDILREKGALAVWWEKNIDGNEGASFAVEQAREHIPYGKPVDEALKLIFKRVFKTLKYSGVAISAVTAPFETSRQPSYKMAYLDSEFGSQYFAKQQRLEEIYRELFRYMPPSAPSISQPDRCAMEACWRSALP